MSEQGCRPPRNLLVYRDVPLFGYPCVIEMELAQVFISKLKD